MPAMKPASVAATKPPVPFSHLVVCSVTSTIKQEALCGEQQPLWEQREGERETKESGEENRRCRRGFADMDR